MSTGPVEHTSIETDDLEQSIEMISTLYTPVRAQVPEDPHAFRFAMAGNSMNGFRIDRVSHSSGYQCTADPMNFVGVVMLSRGHVAYEMGTREVRTSTRQSLLLPHDRTLQVDHSAYDLQFVTVPAAQLEARAREMTGRDDFELYLDLSLTHSHDDEARWRATIEFLGREFRSDDTAMASPLFRHNAQLMLLDAVLTLFPNNSPAAEPPDSGTWMARRVLERATGFIDANVERVIGLRDIAAAADVSTAALTEAFLRQRHLSPLAYVRQVRLQAAARELRTLHGVSGRSVPPSSVKATVVKWGFSSPARFRTLYRESFGTFPEHPHKV